MAVRFSAQMSGQMPGWPGRDPGHVAEAAGRQPQQGAVLGGPVVGQPHERGGGEVRHVGHDRHERVVVVGRQRHDVGAQLADHRPQRA